MVERTARRRRWARRRTTAALAGVAIAIVVVGFSFHCNAGSCNTIRCVFYASNQVDNSQGEKERKKKTKKKKNLKDCLSQEDTESEKVSGVF